MVEDAPLSRERTLGSNPAGPTITYNKVTNPELPINNGLLVEWFKTLACHARDHGFNSRTGRHILNVDNTYDLVLS